MATYVYETIPEKPGDPVTRFEIQQSMKDDPLTAHPDTGQPVKRVITGGFGLMGVKDSGEGHACNITDCPHGHD
jgi:predicted nucleic acid-binding Zn ribbon protein